MLYKIYQCARENSASIVNEPQGPYPTCSTLLRRSVMSLVFPEGHMGNSSVMILGHSPAFWVTGRHRNYELKKTIDIRVSSAINTPNFLFGCVYIGVNGQKGNGKDHCKNILIQRMEQSPERTMGPEKRK